MLTSFGLKLRDALQPKCRRCAKHSNKLEFVAGGPVTGYCLRCLENHQKALDVLYLGGVPTGCSECDKSMDALIAESPGADVRVYVHHKDGIYQLLCKPCSDEYETKRPDLYRNTPYGAKRKI